MFSNGCEILLAADELRCCLQVTENIFYLGLY